MIAGSAARAELPGRAESKATRTKTARVVMRLNFFILFSCNKLERMSRIFEKAKKMEKYAENSFLLMVIGRRTTKVLG